jgi:hypothetical protein
MNRRQFGISTLAVLGYGMGQSLPGLAQAGWTSLFDGKSLDAFAPIGNANWRIEDNALVADNGTGFLVTKAEYADFELKAEFFVEEKTNSGIFIRCTDPQSISTKTAYEVNIWDTRPEQKYGTGAIVDLGAVDPMPKAAGKWNTYEITAKGDTMSVILNGQKTVNAVKDAKFTKGRIALQHAKGVTDETGLLKFRNVVIRTL